MKSRLLTITLAAVLAVFGMVAVLAYVHHANDRAVNGLQAQTVMMANGEIAAGTSLSEASQEHLLGTEKVPDSSLSTAPVSAVTTANGHLVISASMSQGEVLLKNMLVSAGTLTANGTGLAIPPGDMAVTMEMCLDADVAGYVQPGSYIAVFNTEATSGAMQYTCTSHQAPSKGTGVTAVVVAKVEVLSVTSASSAGTSSTGDQVANDPVNPGSSVASGGEVLVTLAATSQTEAEILSLVSNAGDPSFGLLTKGFSTNVDPGYSLSPLSQR